MSKYSVGFGLLLIAAVLILAPSVASSSRFSQGKRGVRHLAQASSTVSFAPASTIFAPVLGPVAIAAGDLNNDGIPDLAIGSPTYQAIFTALGKGDGTFGPWLGGQTTAYPAWIALGDFNNDGNLDAVAVDAASPNIVVGFGEGNGLFYKDLTLKPGPSFQALSVMAVDLNGDGMPDVVGTSSAQDHSGSYVGAVFYFLSNGDGTFQRKQQYASGGATPVQAAVAELDGDHIPDIAVANGSTTGKVGNVGVLLGARGPVFGKARTFSAGVNPRGIAVADFNGDGILDVATVDTDFVDILLGNGDGTFKAPVQYKTGSASIAIVTADFNGDGIPDLAVCNFAIGSVKGTVSILLGNGDGTFQSPVQFDVGHGPWTLVVADFNRDGKPDIATINNTDATVSILLNTTP